MKITIAILIFLAFIYFLIGYISSNAGWYGYEKWKYRKATTTIEESINRGVFVKKLNFKIDSFSGRQFFFDAYIERGFKYGHHTSTQTVPLTGSSFPFQLSFNYRPDKVITVSIRDNQLSKFDSSNASWGYLKLPELPDTIVLDIRGENISSGIIKVW